MIEQFVNSDDAQLWTVAQGHGVPLVLCNGGPGCCDYLAPVAGMLDDIARNPVRGARLWTLGRRAAIHC
jgi:hypothetical protein